MSLLLSGDLRLAKTYVGTDDPDAAVYIAAVETADGQALETATRVAIHSFVKGCKADGIWPAIKASCILAGARTLTGALTPLVGTAPTNFNFVSVNYNRKTGLVGDGSTKYLNSNRLNNADPQNSQHLSTWVSQVSSSTGTTYIGTSNEVGRSTLFRGASGINGNLRATGGVSSFAGTSPLSIGLYGINRSSSSSIDYRVSGIAGTTSSASEAPSAVSIHVFALNPVSNYSNARLAFYSIGESLDLALLDARVTTLINAFGAAIP
jgi:hypothetical protein